MAIPPVRSQGDSGHIQDHNDIGTELAARLPLSGGTLTGSLNGTSATFSGTVSAATPTSNGHLTTKSYVDTAVSSITGGVDGYTKAFASTANYTLSQNIVPYGAVYTSGSFVGSTTSFTNVIITLPAGKFSSTPAASVSTTKQGVHVSGGAFSATSIYTTVQNFTGWPGTNNGGTYGPLGTLGTSIDIQILVLGN